MEDYNRFLLKAWAIVFVALISSAAILLSVINSQKEGMFNYIADNSSFFVGRGCSGTLIDAENKLVLTNFHCIDTYYKPVKDKEGKLLIGEDGKYVAEWVDIPLKQEVYEGNGVTSVYTYAAQVSKWDEDVDLAVIRVDSPLRKNAYAVPIYEGEELHRGDEVITVGNPFRNIGSIGRGTINHPYRKLPIEGKDYILIQHDATQAPGSSGGALLNEQGELIGVTNAGIPGYEVYMAIPYFTIRTFLEQ